MKDVWIRVYIKKNLTGFTGLMGFFSACGERLFGRKTDGRWKIAPL
jgi:hypothetical protein